MFSKRFDSKGVRGFWSVNDIIPWDLGVEEKGVGVGRRKAWKGRRGWARIGEACWSLANTGENSTPY